MKLSKLVFVIVVLFVINLTAQQNPTFKRYYYTGGYLIIFVKENIDGTLLCAGINSRNSHCLIKTDPEGYLIWKKEFITDSENNLGSPFYNNKSVILSENETVYMLSKELNKKYGKLVVREFDENGSIQSEKMFDDADTTSCKAIEKLGDGYCLSVRNMSPTTKNEWASMLIKTDNEFNEQWRQKFSNVSNINEPALTILTDSTFLASVKNKIYKFNNDGNTLGIFNRNDVLSLERVTDTLFVYGVEDKVVALNDNGDFLWYKTGRLMDVVGNRIFMRSMSYIESLIELDHNGETLSNKSFNKSISFLNQIGNYIFLAGGAYSNFSAIIKTRLNFDYTSVSLAPNSRFSYSADSIATYLAYNKNKIYWNSTSDINYIDLDYSVDNGNNWNEIISYLPAETNSFIWEVPADFTEEGLLRIKDSQSHNFNDRKTFRIILKQDYDYISINEIKMWLGNNGDGSHNPNTDGSGLYWPAESNKTLVYEDGLVWGLKVNGEIRVNGNTHIQGIRPGVIKEDGTAGDPFNPVYKIYKVRKDWQLLPPSVERDRYEHDYLNWPAQNGAPFTDNNYDGIYTPFTDEPNWHGDEMLFYVANDLDSLTTFRAYGSPSIGVEQQCLTYGYDREDELKDVVFKKYTIINKSENDWTDMYLSYWIDDDLGSSGDDYVGCDTLLNMGYTYNGDEDDNIYGIPPAIGHMFIQGPITQSLGDSAIFKNRIKIDYKNTPITSHSFYIGGSATYSNPDQGVYNGTIQFYNQMKGKLWNGSPVIDPNTGDTTKFSLSGDPVEGIGWYDGEGWPGGPAPADRYALISSGTFTLAAGDTQEVVIAILAAQGTDRLNSVTELKNTARKVREFYYGQFITDVEEDNNNQPLAFKLEQNYPNPFNPATKIKYSIPAIRTNSNSSVRLIVYDVLGKEVARLVDEKKSPGNYEVVFNASALSSGVYFYRLQYDSFIQTKKMVLLK